MYPSEHSTVTYVPYGESDKVSLVPDINVRGQGSGSVNNQTHYSNKNSTVDQKSHQIIIVLGLLQSLCMLQNCV